MARLNRKATDYLQIGQLVQIPEQVSAPIIYSDRHPNGKTIRIGRVVELFTSGGVAVEFDGGKTWDYANLEALRFQRVF